MKRQPGRPRADVRKADGQRALRAIIEVKRLQAGGLKHDLAIAEVAVRERVSARTVQRWHRHNARLATTMLSVRAAVAPTYAALSGRRGFIERARRVAMLCATARRCWASAIALLPTDLQDLIDTTEAPARSIVRAIAHEAAEARRRGEEARSWFAREVTRQKLRDLLIGSA